jgi:hypothetical protein
LFSYEPVKREHFGKGDDPAAYVVRMMGFDGICDRHMPFHHLGARPICDLFVLSHHP